jgi:UDP-2,3-diacylglucosamine hydrolase
MSTAADKQAQPETVALFVSDLHLQAALPRTTEAFLSFLRDHAARARRLYLLGDIFEYWAGDDDLADPYHRKVVSALRQISDAGTEVFWIAGNRDFLVGERFAEACGLTLLDDPHTVEISGHSFVLTHGDASCTDDHEYQAFRTQVRDPQWQQQFLAMPLAQRKQIIEGLREQSKAAHKTKSYEIMDVNEGAISALFDASAVSTMIHGHTHRPGRHEYDGIAGKRVRYVLPDWDCEGTEQRGGWLGVDAAGVIRRYRYDGMESRE